MKKPYLSFVIPANNEEGSVTRLYREIVKVVKRLRLSYEIIFVDDGSDDSTHEILLRLHKKDRLVRVIRLRGRFGKSIALSVGFGRALGDTIITMDADLQDDPEEIPNFLKKLDEGYDLVSGWKKKRFDPITKTLPSKLGNLLTRLLTGVTLHDLNCGYKAYRKDVVKNLNLYGELYKFIPILARTQKFKVAEIPVKHRRRGYGKSKYGWERNIKGVLDLITVVFLAGYVRRPGHFFGGVGLISFLVGFTIGLYIAYLRITTGSIQYRQPLLFLGVLLMLMGIQFITTGLLAEMIVYSGQKPDYSSYIKESVPKR